MKLGETAKLFSAHYIWRATGAKIAGRALIAGLSSSDANNRLIAGMFLTRGGLRAVPLFREALAHGAPSPLLLRVIGDSGAREFESVLERYAAGPDARLVQAATDALRLLRLADGLGS